MTHRNLSLRERYSRQREQQVQRHGGKGKHRPFGEMQFIRMVRLAFKIANGETWNWAWPVRSTKWHASYLLGILQFFRAFSHTLAILQKFYVWKFPSDWRQLRRETWPKCYGNLSSGLFMFGICRFLSHLHLLTCSWLFDAEVQTTVYLSST